MTYAFVSPLKVLFHYNPIFRKPDPLGKEIKNVACSRLDTILYLEIQKVEEAMKTEKFQQHIGGNAL